MRKSILTTLLALTLSPVSYGQNLLSDRDIMKTAGGVHLIVKFNDQRLHRALLSTPETDKMIQALRADPDKIQQFASAHHVAPLLKDKKALLAGLVASSGEDVTHVRSASLGYDELQVATDDVNQTISALLRTGKFASVEPVHIYRPTAVDDSMYKDQFYLRPYGPRYKSSSNFDLLHTELVNNLGRKVRFAVLDSGSWPHEDVVFSGGYNFVGLGMEPDRGREANPIDQYNRADGTSCQDGHGLAVASILGATSNNSLGIAGAFPSEHAELVPVRVLGCNGGGTLDIMEGLLWASGGEVPGVPTIDQKVDVANLSLGSNSIIGCSKYEQDMINQVVANGVKVVVAAGNDNAPAALHNPASCGNVITVGALMSAGDKADFSNYGSAIDVVAEGNSVYIAQLDKELNNRYANGSGTSFSAPLVAALVGALVAKEPELTHQQTEARLKASAIKNPSKHNNSNCLTYGCGAGLIQVQAALEPFATESVATYTVQHRYEGFKSTADELWLSALQSKSSACQTLKYTFGKAGSATTGVSYKIYASNDGGPMDFLNETSFAQFTHATASNTILGYQQCINGSCSNIVPMYKGNVGAPQVCQ
jgi:serine protease